MKRFIYITLLTAFSMPLLAQSTLFLYEYERNSCYYALELDVTHKRGTFYAGGGGGCYLGLAYLEIDFRFDDYGSDENKDEFSYEKTEKIILYPTMYKYTESLSADIFETYSEPYLRKKGFFFRYDVKDQWNRLEYRYYMFNDKDRNNGYFTPLGKETMYLSEFLKKYQIDWLPPYLERVEQFEYDAFPDPIRTDLKEKHLKRMCK